MSDILLQLSKGKKVTISTEAFKSMKSDLNALNIAFKISASVSKFKTILQKV
jgi:hypothetical protein